MATQGNGAASAWSAMRRLYEGQAVTLELLAAISGRSPETVERRAQREDWQALDGASMAELAERIARLMASMIRETERIEKEAREGAYDKARIDAITATMRMLEKLSEINESRQARQEDEQKTDADIAETLKRIDERIVLLARGFARELVGDRISDGEGIAAHRA